MAVKHSLVVAAVIASLAFIVSLSGAADGVEEANPTCRTATAILLTGDGQNDELAVRMMREVIAKNSDWKLVGTIPEDRVGEVAMVRYDVRSTYRGGPTVAYTVRCGHGGTCNDVAHKFRAEHPTLTPAPRVYCGDLSRILTQPTIIP